MKVMPRSTAAWTRRTLSASSMPFFAICDPPSPIPETLSRLLDALLRDMRPAKPDRRDRLARLAELAVEHVPPELAGVAQLRQDRGTAGGAVGDRLGRGWRDGGAREARR